MKKAIWWIVGIVVVIVIIIIISMGGSNSTGPIKIGFIGPLTGDVTSLGVASKAAVEVATDEINSSGGINGRLIQVIYEDGQCSPVHLRKSPELDDH